MCSNGEAIPKSVVVQILAASRYATLMRMDRQTSYPHDTCEQHGWFSKDVQSCAAMQRNDLSKYLKGPGHQFYSAAQHAESSIEDTGA